MALTVREIREARERIAPYIVSTPLLRLHQLDRYLGCQVFVKAECMQITGSFKLRGAMNRVLLLTDEEKTRGIVAASSGNHGKAIAYTAKMLGIHATIVLPYGASRIKADTIRSLGAEIVQCDVADRFTLAETLSRERGAVLVPPFNDETVMAGQGTAALELLEQCPDLDALIVPVSGGGLMGGVSVAVKAVSPKTKVYGAEPAVLPRYTASLQAGRPVHVEKRTTVADGLVTLIPGELCFPYVRANTDGFADVEEEAILRGMKLLLTEGKLLCEPSGAIGIGAVLQHLIPVRPEEKVCFFISGGSVALEQLRMLENVQIESHESAAIP